jgi:cation diffusion facilitator CzcD-associated flavoprotein CzcO
VIVIGGGPAGLATARELQRRGVECVVLEQGEEVGNCWVNTYESLRLHTGKHLSALPGLRFARGTGLFPTRHEFVRYLQHYTQHFKLPIELDTCVTRITRNGDWHVQTNKGSFQSKALVIATGIMSNPIQPNLPGAREYRGRLLHSVDYRRPEDFKGQRVLVIGVGNSGGEIASELGRAGIDTTIAVRSGANVVPLKIAGLPTQYLAFLLRKLPRSVQDWVVERIRRRNERRRPPVLPRPTHSPLDAIPLIGFHLVDAIAAGSVKLRGGIDRFTADGVQFADGKTEHFNAVILATGFRPALGPLGDLVRVNARGFANRVDRVQSADQPSLFFVGHNYDATGGLRNIAIDARLVANALSSIKSRRTA